MLRIKKKTGTMKVIVPWDPSIDLKKSNMKKYLEDLNLEHVKFVDGKSAAIIHLTCIPQWVTAKLAKVDIENPTSTIMSYFRFSVEKIENLDMHLLTESVELEGGTGTWHAEDKASGPDGTSIPCISEDLALQAFNIEFMTFISTITQKRAFLRPGTPKPYAQALSYFLPTTEKKASK
jgi:hypothetical protein